MGEKYRLYMKKLIDNAVSFNFKRKKNGKEDKERQIENDRTTYYICERSLKSQS
jgi:hypothetical protein